MGRGGDRKGSVGWEIGRGRKGWSGDRKGSVGWEIGRGRKGRGGEGRGVPVQERFAC